MKKNSDLRILFAFLANLVFAALEFVGGALTGSVAISSDAVHDMGDAASLGVSYLLERRSRQARERGEEKRAERLSAIGGMITAAVLLIGSAAVCVRAVLRILHPQSVDLDGMILFAIVGIAVNLAAALLTHDRKSINERAVFLHMLEDLLGWVLTLIGALVMKVAELPLLDPVLSLVIAVFISFHASKILANAVSRLRG